METTATQVLTRIVLFQTEGDEIVDEDMLEMAPLKNRFSFFENFKDKEEERQKQKKGRSSPSRDVSLSVPTQ